MTDILADRFNTYICPFCAKIWTSQLEWKVLALIPLQIHHSTVIDVEFINTYIKLFHSRFFASIIFGFKWFLHGLSGHWYNSKYFISINEILFFPMHPLRCWHGHGHYLNVLIINCNWTGLNLFTFTPSSIQQNGPWS